jgi:hypothetical protein
MSPGVRRLYVPWRVEVEVDAEGMPWTVEGVAVAAIREEWVVEDRWWTLRRLWRHYFELALADGRNVVVFRSSNGRWYRQRG